MIYIGIDTGTHTGFAVWDTEMKTFLEMETLPIHKAMEKVFQYATMFDQLKVIFEDARQRRWYGRTRAETDKKMQGAGSVKRDAKIWEDFLTDKKIDYLAVHPVKGGTKMTPERFGKLTKYKGRTSEHARDAAMLVFGR